MKTIAGALTAWGPFGLFFLSIFDSAGIPLPAAVDALLTATAAVNPREAYFAALLATIGSVIGSMALLWIARIGGQAYLDRRTGSGRGAKFRHWFQTYGLVTVFIPALLPIPMPLKVFVISAGALGVRRRLFLAVMLAARIPRYFGLAYLGSQLGEHTMSWLGEHMWQLLAFSGALAILLILLIRLQSRGSRSPTHP
ncbi:MAG: VTT domain-containing protein [Acidobacteria bacterium]|nr:VTT domain-containing protein [Acidobacteriota bacterium]